MIKILLIDDDVKLCGLLKNFLETDSLQVDCLHDGDDAIERLLGSDAVRYDLLLLDVTLPGKTGFTVLKTIRERGLEVPVLMLTARDEAVDKITGLNGGADDYVCKPCDPGELAARIAAILRRTRGNDEKAGADVTTLKVDDIKLDYLTQIARISRRSVTLTTTESRLLERLLRNAGEVVSLESLCRDVLEREYSSKDRSIHTHISRLRQKLGCHPDGSIRIKAIRGKGFVFTKASACE